MEQCTNENSSCLGNKPGRLTRGRKPNVNAKKASQEPPTNYLKGRTVANEEVSATGHPPAAWVQAKPIWLEVVFTPSKNAEAWLNQGPRGLESGTGLGLGGKGTDGLVRGVLSTLRRPLLFPDQPPAASPLIHPPACSSVPWPAGLFPWD